LDAWRGNGKLLQPPGERNLAMIEPLLHLPNLRQHRTHMGLVAFVDSDVGKALHCLSD
jgi:hypothetical protein